MVVTAAGIAMDISRVASAKARSPITVMSLSAGSEMLVRNDAPLNARSPMEVTVRGRVTSVTLVTPPNARGPMAVTPLGTATVPTHPLPVVTVLVESSIVIPPPPEQDTVDAMADAGAMAMAARNASSSPERQLRAEGFVSMGVDSSSLSGRHRACAQCEIMSILRAPE
jgi:hypothetical protein